MNGMARFIYEVVELISFACMAAVFSTEQTHSTASVQYATDTVHIICSVARMLFVHFMKQIRTISIILKLLNHEKYIWHSRIQCSTAIRKQRAYFVVWSYSKWIELNCRCCRFVDVLLPWVTNFVFRWVATASLGCSFLFAFTPKRVQISAT